MQATRQVALVAGGGRDLEGQELSLYRRRRRGGSLTCYENEWLDALWPHQLDMLEDTSVQLDADDRRVRAEIAYYPEGYGWHKTVGGGLPDDWTDAELPRRRPRDWTRVRHVRFSRVGGRRRPNLRGHGRTRARERRPAGARRPAASSATSGSDPGDPDSSEPPRLTLPRHPRYGPCSPSLLAVLLLDMEAPSC